MKLDDKITRLFTKELENSSKSVYDLFEWKEVDVVLTNYKTGKVITEMNDLEFPVSYSQTACDIIASKYFRKNGVPTRRGQEHSMKQVAHRMVNFWVESMYDEILITDEQKSIVYDELVFMFLSQMWAPNSPQWFNTGLKHTYDINGRGQGHYYYDDEFGDVVETTDAYTRTQGSACFIISVRDSLVGEKSLTDQLIRETLLFKYGSGVGTNWSSIRSRNEFLSGGGKSSGLLSFLKVSDRNAGAIKSGGTTRRAAKMNVLNLAHPEILSFIQWKAKEEDKVVALSKMGYDVSIDGEAYETVSGQNANNSIRVPDLFMKDLDDPEAMWQLKGIVDHQMDSEISVSKLWNEAAYAAWRCGDPGIQFDDTINAWHTCPYGEDGRYNAPHNRINSSNPCSEYMFLDDTACNLASINIKKFYDEETGTIKIDEYLHCILMIQLVLESTIHWGQFPTRDIARKSHVFRTTGLGLTNMGAMFMEMGIAYDSVEARNVGASLCSLMTGYSYYTSALMAEKIGPFSGYEKNKEHMKKVIRNHAKAAVYSQTDTKIEDVETLPIAIDHSVLEECGHANLAVSISRIWENCISAGEEHGYRNAQVTVLAPTGTIAFAMDCATTSSEPFFSHIAFKKLVGGGSMEIINPSLEKALERLGYADNEIKDIVNYVLRKENVNGYDMIVDGKIEDAPHLKKEHYCVFDTANNCGTGSRFIAPDGHVKMMGSLTPHITGAISKTVNIPKTATVEDVKEIYLLAWKWGVKAIALYRDGCKATQPLNSQIGEEKEKDITEYTYNELVDYIKSGKQQSKLVRVKPHGIRIAKVHEAAIGGLKLYITTSFYEDGRLGEVYVSSGRQGSLTKGLLDSISTIISEMLQYGVPAEDIARMYRGQKYEPSGFVSGHPYIKCVDSISDLISKIIDIEQGNFTYCQVKPKEWEEGKVKAISNVDLLYTQNNTNNECNSEYTEKNDFSINYSQAEAVHGEVCANCKSPKLVKNGTCKVCTQCGTTTGCS